MNILQIDEKWAVRFDPKNNDRPMEWLRNGNTQCEFDENNATVAMFYALKEANTDLTQSRAETAAAYERAAQVYIDGDWDWYSDADDAIRALATPEQSSALAAIEAAAEARGMRRAAELALQRKGDGTATLYHPYDKGYLAACDSCAAAIIALIGEKK